MNMPGKGQITSERVENDRRGRPRKPSLEPKNNYLALRSNLGKSVFVRRFVHHIRHIMTPIPHHILWCYGEYQTLYGTLDGVDFQHGWPDFWHYIAMYFVTVCPLSSSNKK
jgi:hypothetical protein